MYLFILESIGTSELILIGIVALVVFGPRKLPQMAKTLGKMMAEFRNTTNEFKTTWQKEVSFEEESRQLKNIFQEEETQKINSFEEKPVKEVSITTAAPVIKQLDAKEVEKIFDLEKQKSKSLEIETDNVGKKDWL